MSLTFEQELFKQTNQSAIDFSLKTLGSLFLLNGAAATALLAQSSLPLKWPALIFGLAALWTVAAMGISYVFVLFLGETFVAPPPESPDAPWILLPLKESHKTLVLLKGVGPQISLNQITEWRIRLMMFSLVPAVLFLLGLLAAGLIMAGSS
jgi:hypothetical protein